MSDDTISRQAAIDALEQDEKYNEDIPLRADGVRDAIITISTLPSAQQWIPVTERLPRKRDWYLGIFKEPDTGWINPIPFICDYLLGTKSKVTTKEGWILRGFTDREEYIDYYFNLECVAWMPLPKPYTERKTDDGE